MLASESSFHVFGCHLWFPGLYGSEKQGVRCSRTLQGAPFSRAVGATRQAQRRLKPAATENQPSCDTGGERGPMARSNPNTPESNAWPVSAAGRPLWLSSSELRVCGGGVELPCAPPVSLQVGTLAIPLARLRFGTAPRSDFASISLDLHHDQPPVVFAPLPQRPPNKRPYCTY
jgi:hypothetical protein